MRSKMNKMPRLAACLASLLCCTPVWAQQDLVDDGDEIELRRYTVEVIIFRYAEDVAAVGELFLPDEPDLEAPLHAGADINLHIPALLPDDYVPDVHLRLILYKRISAAETHDELRELQVELIDRFGLLPDATKNLLRLAAIKKRATLLGIEKIDVADRGGYFVFGKDSRIDPLALIRLVQDDSRRYRLKGSHRLQIATELGDIEKRFVTIENLLERLAVKDEENA